LIHIIKKKATRKQIGEMLETLSTYIKLAVDVRRAVIAGGGILHADCEAMLLAEGSNQEDVWGADWLPETKQVKTEALINVRPKQGNRTMIIQNKEVRKKVEQIVMHLLG